MCRKKIAVLGLICIAISLAQAACSNVEEQAQSEPCANKIGPKIGTSRNKFYVLFVGASERYTFFEACGAIKVPVFISMDQSERLKKFRDDDIDLNKKYTILEVEGNFIRLHYESDILLDEIINVNRISTPPKFMYRYLN